MLNDWNGNLTIDEKNGTILSAMMGAGIKNEDNTFPFCTIKASKVPLLFNTTSKL